MRAEVAVLVIPTALLKLEKVLAAGNAVLFNLRLVSSGDRIPPLTSGPVQRRLDFRCRKLPLGDEYHRRVASRKHMVLKPTLCIGVEGTRTGVHRERSGSGATAKNSGATKPESPQSPASTQSGCPVLVAGSE